MRLSGSVFDRDELFDEIEMNFEEAKAWKIKGVIIAKHDYFLLFLSKSHEQQ